MINQSVFIQDATSPNNNGKSLPVVHPAINCLL